MNTQPKIIKNKLGLLNSVVSPILFSELPPRPMTQAVADIPPIDTSSPKR